MCTFSTIVHYYYVFFDLRMCILHDIHDIHGWMSYFLNLRKFQACENSTWEERLGSYGLTLHELAVLAAT